MELDYGRDIVIQETTGQLHGEEIPQKELSAGMEPLSQEVPGVQRLAGWESLYKSPIFLRFQFIFYSCTMLRSLC